MKLYFHEKMSNLYFKWEINKEQRSIYVHEKRYGTWQCIQCIRDWDFASSLNFARTMLHLGQWKRIKCINGRKAS